MNGGHDARAVASTAWEAVVIGAGPAGAVLSHQLARRGWKVLLVERKTFPRDKVCGGCLNGLAISALEAAGMPTLCDDLHAPHLSRLRLRQGGRSITISAPMGRAVLRRSFDAALVQQAQSVGVTFLPATTAHVLPGEANSDAPLRVRLQGLPSAGAQEFEVESNLVFAADGLAHPSLENLPGFHTAVKPTSRVGLGASWKVEDWPDAADCVSMSVGRHGYVGAVRTAEGEINVAVAVDPAKLRATGPREMVRDIWREAGANFPDPPEEIHWLGTPPLTRRTTPLAMRRLFLLGDAAGYVEPFTGEGMAWALAAALAVVPLAEQAREQWDDRLSARWEQTFAKIVRRRQWVCRAVAMIVRRPWLSAGAIRLVQQFPQCTETLILRLNRSLDHAELVP